MTGFRSTLAAVDMSGSPPAHRPNRGGVVAALCGRNAVISRAGKLEFVWYAASGFTLGQQDCYEGMDQVQESDRVFSVLADHRHRRRGGDHNPDPLRRFGQRRRH